MRTFTKSLVVILAVTIITFATGAKCRCSAPPGNLVAAYIFEDQTDDQTAKYDMNSNTFRGAAPSGFPFTYVPLNKLVVTPLLTFINLRSETKRLDPLLPDRLYDNAITGKTTQQLINNSKPEEEVKKRWQQFLTSYNNSSQDYYFSKIELRPYPFLKDDQTTSNAPERTYHKLEAIPDYRAIISENGKKYFTSESDFSIGAAAQTLVNFQTVRQGIKFLNENALPAGADTYQSNNIYIKQNARTALLRVGSLQATISFAGKSTFKFEVQLNRLVARLELKSWTFDKKNYCQGWVFTGFDFYDEHFSVCHDDYHQEYSPTQQPVINGRLILGFHNKPHATGVKKLTELARDGDDYSQFPNLTVRGKKATPEWRNYQQYDYSIEVGSLRKG